MGFVYRLECESCGYVLPHVTIGLAAGCGSTLSLIQDRQSGAIRQIDVSNADITQHTGQSEFANDDEWIAAMDSFVESQMAPTESQIAPHEAICPDCEKQLKVESAGIA